MFNRDKFKALTHYVCWKTEPSKLGAVKLNKVLWFVEVTSFAQNGVPMTGARFAKRKFGPVPKAIVPVVDELRANDAIRVEEVEFFGHKKKQYVCANKPNMDDFSEGDVSLIDEIIDLVTDGHTARSISDLTHDSIWKLADMGEEIPLHAVLASKLGNITDADISRAHVRMSGGN